MASFPKLKTDAVMQYPGGKSLRFASEVVRFVDGGEQRYRDAAGPLRRWVVRLDLLDECEIATLEGFFTANQGAFGSFTFTDPWDGVEYTDCSLEEDALEVAFTGEMRGRAALVVRENRSEMPYFPQLATGAMGQFPLVKRRRARTVTNTCADGRQVKLADAAAAGTEWRLGFQELTDEEMETLLAFFASVEGRLGSFTFLDPAGNLLAWSEQLDEAVWEKGPLVTVVPEAGAWRVTNTGGSTALLAQTLEVPEPFYYCLSMYARGANGALARGGERREFPAAAEWRRLAFASQGQGTGETVRFGLELGPGASVEVFGMQVEAQIGASGYQRTFSRGGVYENARFGSDELQVTTAGPGRHGCELTVIHGERI